jgi:heterodisulfide reductase subunit A-like polyferredoxin
MTAALSLAKGGFPVHLVERESALGGNLRHLHIAHDGVDPQEVLGRLVAAMEAQEAITVHTNSEVIATRGFRGNFASVIRDADGNPMEIAHGATILATGAQEYRGAVYSYGQDPRVVTQQEFEARLVGQGPLPESVVMIQCVGPAEAYCSRICCTVALKNAIALKDRNPEAQVTVLYKDIRTYGFKERLYTEARERGVLFIHYDDEHRPEILGEGPLTLRVWEETLGVPLELQPELLVLSMPAVPQPDVAALAKRFKVSLDADDFFLEAHVKLRPVDFATDGVFMAGMAHYPKLLDETLIQAQAAAGRAARILSQETLTAGGRVAVVDESRCTGCLTCVRICPFNVPKIEADLTGVGNLMGAAKIEPTICQGCGSCVAECPAQAIQLMHYTDRQMIAKVDALLRPGVGFVPLSALAETGD